MLTFYYATNTCALASHIALEEAGTDYEARWIDFGAAEQTKPDYLKINPKGRVPSLMTERGVLTETPAILAYVAQTHAAAQLAPLDDPFAFAELQSFMRLPLLDGACCARSPRSRLPLGGRPGGA